MQTVKLVRELHEAFGLPVEKYPVIREEAVDLRVRLIQEELDELKEALDANDLCETLDALTDLQYVLDGAFLTFGMHKLKQLAFEEVHRSNMSKLDDDGKPVFRDDGKFTKGPNYRKPELSSILLSIE